VVVVVSVESVIVIVNTSVSVETIVVTVVV
jgi:hypothetical protein